MGFLIFITIAFRIQSCSLAKLKHQKNNCSPNLRGEGDYFGEVAIDFEKI